MPARSETICSIVFVTPVVQVVNIGDPLKLAHRFAQAFAKSHFKSQQWQIDKRLGQLQSCPLLLPGRQPLERHDGVLVVASAFQGSICARFRQIDEAVG